MRDEIARERPPDGARPGAGPSQRDGPRWRPRRDGEATAPTRRFLMHTAIAQTPRGWPRSSPAAAGPLTPMVSARRPTERQPPDKRPRGKGRARASERGEELLATQHRTAGVVPSWSDREANRETNANVARARRQFIVYRLLVCFVPAPAATSDRHEGTCPNARFGK